MKLFALALTALFVIATSPAQIPVPEPANHTFDEKQWLSVKEDSTLSKLAGKIELVKISAGGISRLGIIFPNTGKRYNVWYRMVVTKNGKQVAPVVHWLMEPGEKPLKAGVYDTIVAPGLASDYVGTTFTFYPHDTVDGVGSSGKKVRGKKIVLSEKTAKQLRAKG